MLLSTYEEDDYDFAGSGATAYVAKAALAPERLSAAWAAATDGHGGRCA